MVDRFEMMTAHSEQVVNRTVDRAGTVYFVGDTNTMEEVPQPYPAAL